MPTVLSRDGFQVRIYLPPREHGPPHVHVVKHDTEAVLVLGSGDDVPRVEEVYGMRTSDVVRAFRLVMEHHAVLLEHWRRHHGRALDQTSAD